MTKQDHRLRQLQTHGMNWAVDAAFEDTLREVVIPNLGSLESAGAAPVKRTLTRTVHRLEFAGRAVFIKHHVVRSIKERLKYLVLPSRAAAEWRTSLGMAARGLPAPRCLALGERRVAGVLREAVLVSEAVDGALPFSRALEDDRTLLSRAARMIRSMHDADVLHRDLHGGNILVRGTELTFIDLHRASVGRPVSRSRRIRSVAQFLAAVTPLLGHGDVRQFVCEYLGPDATANEADRFSRAVETRITGLRDLRCASRTRRCVKESTGFRIESSGGLRVHRRAEFAAEHVQLAIRRHNETIAAGRAGAVLKCDNRTRVSVVDPGVDGMPVLCVKESTRPGILQRLGDIFIGSPAMRAWVGANGLLVRGIPTPRPLAIAEAGRRSYIITEYVGDSDTLDRCIVARRGPERGEPVRKWRGLIEAAAGFVRLVHSHRLRHRDLKAKNILVREKDDSPEFYLVDTGDVRFGRKPSLAYKIKNLVQLDCLVHPPSRTDRLRFYRHYAAGDAKLCRRDVPAEIAVTSRAKYRRWLERRNRLERQK